MSIFSRRRPPVNVIVDFDEASAFSSPLNAISPSNADAADRTGTTASRKSGGGVMGEGCR